jgi:hypothetical protein
VEDQLPHAPATSNQQLATLSSLPLLVLGVRADHPHDALAADDLAILTDPLDAGSNLHDRLDGLPPRNSLAAMD